MEPLLAEFALSHPLWILLLLAATPVLLLAAVRARAIGGRALFMAGIRFALTLTLVLALAGLQWIGRSTEPTTAFVWDRSPSATGSQAAAEALLRELAPAETDSPSPLVVDVAEGQIGESLLLAAAGESVDRIVLLSDGRFSLDRILPAALGTNIPISTAPFEAFAGPEVAIESLAATDDGASFTVRVIARSTTATQSTLEFSWPGGKERVAWSLHAGVSELHKKLEDLPPGEVVTVTISGAQDRFTENNRRSIRLPVRRTPRVWLVGGDTAERLAARSQWAGRRVAATDLLASLDSSECDLLIFADLAPGELSSDAWQRVRRFVREEGGGLLVCGGEATLGREQLAGSTLESLLPVRAWEPSADRAQSLALVLVIDNSSSMLEENRIALAQQAARQTVELLAPTDLVGLMAFSTEAEWISPLEAARDKPKLRERIDALKAYGSTNMYPALLRAQAALEPCRADRRHVILLTDGVSTPGEFARLAREFARGQITISTVSVSPGADQTILQDIAAIAGGRHYHCDDPREIPAILVRETRSAAQPAAESATPLVLRHLPGLALDSAPAVLRHTPTDPKPAAEVLAVASQGEPLFAWWRYGLGVAAVFTGDPTAGEWPKWTEKSGFWNGLARLAARRSEPNAVATWKEEEGGLRLAIDAFEPGSPKRRQGLELIAEIQGPEGTPSTAECREVAPGRYEVELGEPRLGEYRVHITEGESESSTKVLETSYFHDYPREFELGPTNEANLKQLAAATGAVFQTSGDGLGQLSGATKLHARPLWRGLLLVAVGLLLLEAGLRRIGRKEPPR